MAAGDLKLSPKHGLNPVLMVCFLCNEDTGELALLGKFTDDDSEAPRRGMLNKEPCQKCRVWMTKGVIFISTRDGEEGIDNPYRTGGWCVVKDEAVARMVSTPSLLEAILKTRVAFVEDSVWSKIGLPKVEINGEPLQLELVTPK